MDSNNGSHSEALPWKNHACTALYLYGCWYWKKYLNYACHIRHNIIMYVQWNPHVGNQADTSLLQPTYTCTLRWHLFVGIIFPQFWLERYYVSAKFRDLQAKYVCMRMSSVPLAHIIHMKPSSKQTSCMLWQTDWLPLSRPSSWKACNNILASKQSAAKLKRSPD